MKPKKTILITGGAGRLGSNLAMTIVKKGHNVVLGDIDSSKLSKIKNKVDSSNLLVFSSDLTKKKNITKFIKYSLANFGSIDSLVHCSYPKSKKWGTKFENLDEKCLHEDLKNQLGSSIILAQEIMKQFMKQKKGNLILISSILGVQAPKFEHYKNLKIISPIEYSAIKSGIISIVRYLSKYYRNKNIRVNCISPGGIEDKQSRVFKNRYKKSCNSKGLLHSEDVVNSIIFLLSEKSKYINGQNLIIDDGWSL